MTVAVLWLVVLLLANGFFVAAEFAYIAARRNVLEQRAGTAAAAAVRLTGDLSLTLAGAQLGITMATLVLGAVVEPAVAALLSPVIDLVINVSDEALHTVSLVVSVSLVVFLHMVIGEMAPKNIAIAAPERSAVALALPFRAFLVVFRPVIGLLNGMANLVLRVFGIKVTDAVERSHSAEDLATIIASGHREGIIEDFAHRLLAGAIVFGERDAAAAMVPRLDVVAVPDTAMLSEVEQLMISSGYSRILVHRGDFDDVVGFVHVKDLLLLDHDDSDRPLDPAMIRPLPVVPEAAAVQSILSEMQQTRSHIALVVDEHGSTSGIITLEDIAEELVGDIRDEHDRRRTEVRRTVNGFVASGGVRIDRLAELGVVLAKGEYETVGGLVMDRLGRVAVVGDRITEDGWRITVTRMQGRRIVEVIIESTDRIP